ncbi:DUF4126 family protein [Phenylobacterium sp.]|uniref:DUF4126 family protein n=1 Tax=Phenylobacterium sp. TaxID=1871053 RepID=UPI002FD9BA3C
MIPSLLIGLVAGARAMTPFTVVSDAAASGSLPADNGAPRWLGRPSAALFAKLAAAGELMGDKQASAPDRTVAPGLIVRAMTGALAGAALAPRRQAIGGAVLGGLAAIGASYVTLALRKQAMARFGQTPTGLVEDALCLALARHALCQAADRPLAPARR